MKSAPFSAPLICKASGVSEPGTFIRSFNRRDSPQGRSLVAVSNNIGSIEELEEQINVLRSERNKLHAAIREKKNRMKEINELRQAIRDYRRTKDVYAQYKASGRILARRASRRHDEK